ncbi:hypothetical protein I5Q34_15140 [Streptomyces sp. AV19]|uniref:hypothetical protein n=1 Tax=Streptomyces sp. AV19 TaxID=2793068 RepID=UPI0018FE9AE0|nr:hypothetical protein [Streptomyces sp. AV19]MBH1935590.1 hypothetical protein [Streptomyces sp. AV19]MDG4534477.1 hypothetical protein [Streptomyces sp. AV19]
MGFFYVAFLVFFLYLALAILLCKKVARVTTARTGWAMAFMLVVLPVVLLVIGGMIDADRTAS